MEQTIVSSLPQKISFKIKINQPAERKYNNQPNLEDIITDRIYGDTSSFGSTCIETQIIETNNCSQGSTRMC